MAAGYFYGEAVADSLGWRAPFFIEAAFAIPLVAFTLLAPAVDLKGRSASRPSNSGKLRHAAVAYARKTVNLFAPPLPPPQPRVPKLAPKKICACGMIVCIDCCGASIGTDVAC